MLPEERVVEEAEAPPEGAAKRGAREERVERPQAQFGHRIPDDLVEEIEMVPPVPLVQRVVGGARPETRESTPGGCGQLRVWRLQGYEFRFGLKHCDQKTQSVTCLLYFPPSSQLPQPFVQV